MAYIYKITNDINNKIYIGKTRDTVLERWKEHCREYKRQCNKNRPLYRAMNKYGIEHFYIEEIESTNEPEEREKYWISYYDSYKNGYNATLGGDGRPYVERDNIIKLYDQGLTIYAISKITQHDIKTIRNILNDLGVTQEERIERGNQALTHKVAMLDKNTNEVLQIFSSLKDAYEFLHKEHSGHIASVCKGKRQLAYGYGWKYL